MDRPNINTPFAASKAPKRWSRLREEGPPDSHSVRVLANLWRWIADLSQEVGFAAQRHFATVFHTPVGMTPRAYHGSVAGNKKVARFRKFRRNPIDLTRAS